MHDQENRIVTFKTQKFAPIAMLQSRCTDYPYKDWRFRCIEDQKAFLTIFTKRGLPLRFEIGPLYVKLVENEIEPLADLTGVPFAPGYLL